MFNAIKVSVLLALFACGSAFTTPATQAAISTDTNKETKNVFNLLLAQIPGTTDLAISWSATTNGPYQVLVYDVNVTPVLPVYNAFIAGFSTVAPNLQSGRTYRVRVSNAFGVVMGTITIL
jgi:hypothetical protein